jgi:hypothetical protein
VSNFRIEMISSGGFGRTDQKVRDPGIDNKPTFFALVEL